MKLFRMLVALSALAVVSTGCDDGTNILNPADLAPPLGLTSVTGDQSVTLIWQASNYGENRDGFQIFQATGTQSGTPQEIPAAFGTTAVAEVTDSDPAGTFSYTVTGLTNGQTYSFLVVAFKNSGDDVSRPSNIVVDTPRQESSSSITLRPGVNAFLDVAADPPVGTATAGAGSDVQAQSFNAGAGNRPGLVAINGARIQDKGFAADWDEVDEAPLNIDSYPSEDFSVQALAGHVYVVLTADNHYAKLWVRAVNETNFSVTMDVAYQNQAGNNELDADVPVR